jgi:NAD(P)-dependent dehydrogenase (short-subunit alcohol dehydrogenase family)
MYDLDSVLGLGIAKRLGKEGGKVVLIDKDETQLVKTIEVLKKDSITHVLLLDLPIVNVHCLGITSDVTNSDHIDRAVKASRLDKLVFVITN